MNNKEKTKYIYWDRPSQRELDGLKPQKMGQSLQDTLKRHFGLDKKDKDE